MWDGRLGREPLRELCGLSVGQRRQGTCADNRGGRTSRSRSETVQSSTLRVRVERRQRVDVIDGPEDYYSV